MLNNTSGFRHFTVDFIFVIHELNAGRAMAMPISVFTYFSEV